MRRSEWLRLAAIPLELLMVPFFVVIAAMARFWPKRFDVGIGPDRLITSIYHKQALQRVGYRVETFAPGGTYITQEFDVTLSGWQSNALGVFLSPYVLLARALFTYRCLFFYFYGGCLNRPVIGRLEPLLYALAGTKVVVMPYGSDVQVMTRSRNLHFRHAMGIDYPDIILNHRRIARNVDRWTRHADWVIGGCEWVDYMLRWDTLMSGHFAIDLERWKPLPTPPSNGTFKVLHAPNHKAVKGTQYLVDAVEQLKREGYDIELVLLQRVSNDRIREAMAEVDLVADQFVIGWYAMFAMEAMAMEKPVLCYLRDDLVELYAKTGVLPPGDLPILNTGPLGVADRLRWAYAHRDELPELGRRGRAFLEKHHSIEAIGRVFADILPRIGIAPSGARG